MFSFSSEFSALPSALKPWDSSRYTPTSTQPPQETTSARWKYDPSRYIPRELAKEGKAVEHAYEIPDGRRPSNRLIPEASREVDLSRTVQPRPFQKWTYGNEPPDLAAERTSSSVSYWGTDLEPEPYFAETRPGYDLLLQTMQDEEEQPLHLLSHKDSLERFKPLTKPEQLSIDTVETNHFSALSLHQEQILSQIQQERRLSQMTLEAIDSAEAATPLESQPLWNNIVPPVQLSFLTAQAQADSQRLFEHIVDPREPSLSREQLHELLLHSGLSRGDLGNVWTLSDTLKAGQLLFPEFALAMYLCNLKLSGQELPSTLSDQIKSEVSNMVDIISFNIIEDELPSTPQSTASQGPSTYTPLPVQQRQAQTIRSNDIRVGVLTVSNWNDTPIIGMSSIEEEMVGDMSTHRRTEAGNDFVIRSDVSTAALDICPEVYDWIKANPVLDAKQSDPITVVRPLGSGSIGSVEEVQLAETALVRKRVTLPPQKREAAYLLGIIRDEVAILSKLRHPNIVHFVGSYEDQRHARCSSYCLLMTPVGESDLENFLDTTGELERTSELRKRSRSWIRAWYADLASAVEYMHSQGVRHQDIKPSNIIHRGAQIFFTDFSSSSRFRVGHTTSTDSPARSTPIYAAPERAQGVEGRYGRAFDIFGLGCVFCDMLSVELGRTVPDFHDYLRPDGKVTKYLFSENLASVRTWFLNEQRSPSWFWKNCISEMLQEDRELRPTASEVLKICPSSVSHPATWNLSNDSGMSDMVARRRSKMIRKIPGAFPM